MVARHRCAGLRADGQPCQGPPQSDRAYCWKHDPEHATEVAEARCLGGLRRKRDATVQRAYEFHGLESVQDIRRLLEIAVLDTLGLENSIARARTLAYLAMVALKSLETGDLEERLRVLEGVVLHAALPAASPFDEDDADVDGEEP